MKHIWKAAVLAATIALGLASPEPGHGQEDVTRIDCTDRSRVYNELERE